MDEITSILQPLPPGQAPVQDTWKFADETVGQPEVLFAVEAVHQQQDEESTGKCPAGIGDLRKLVTAAGGTIDGRGSSREWLLRHFGQIPSIGAQTSAPASR